MSHPSRAPPRIFLPLLAAAAASAQNGNWTLVKLPNTHCLDGSPGAYYIRGPLTPGSPANTFIVYFEGGGWCAGLENCFDRAQSDLGSSTKYPSLPPNVAPNTVGYEGASLFTSPSFANATVAYAKYCTGDSWTSFNATPSFFNNTLLYFQGRPMLDSLIASLLTRGLSAARNVLIAGCSAGGLTAYTHVDYIASLLAPGTFVAGLADAMFAFPFGAFAGGPSPIFNVFEWVASLNSSAGLQQGCLNHFGESNASQCLFGGVVAPFVQSPLFVVNSKHDTWQEITVVALNKTRCPGTIAANGTITLCLPEFPAEGTYWVEYGQFMAASLAALPKRHGGFLTNCPLHCQTGAGWADPSTGTVATLGQAVERWWSDAVAHAGEPGFVAPRFVADDADQCVGGCAHCATHEE